MENQNNYQSKCLLNSEKMFKLKLLKTEWELNLSQNDHLPFQVQKTAIQKHVKNLPIPLSYSNYNYDSCECVVLYYYKNT